MKMLRGPYKNVQQEERYSRMDAALRRQKRRKSE